MIYEYICEKTRERKQIRASMRNPPPVKFRQSGKLWLRVWGDVQFFNGHKNQGPRFADRTVPNVAPTLPRNPLPFVERKVGKTVVREHTDGTFSDRDGSRVVESADHMKRLCDQYGQVWEKS